MAILGGAGNPVGGSFTGGSQSLELLGNHIYGYSGPVSVGNSETTMIDFTTGNYYSVCQWFGNYNQATTEAVATEDFRFILSLNGSRIATQEKEASKPTSDTEQDIIIPAYTVLKVTCRNYSGSVTEDMGFVITGRIYRQ